MCGRVLGGSFFHGFFQTECNWRLRFLIRCGPERRERASASMADDDSSAATASIIVKFEGADHKIQFSRGSSGSAVERAICVSCGVPWGSVTQLVDASGVVYATDPAAFPDGKELVLQVFATPGEARTDGAPARQRQQAVRCWGHCARRSLCAAVTRSVLFRRALHHPAAAGGAA